MAKVGKRYYNRGDTQGRTCRILMRQMEMAKLPQICPRIACKIFTNCGKKSDIMELRKKDSEEDESMKKMKKIVAAMLAMAMTASVSFTAVAAEKTYTVIDGVSMDISHNIEIDGTDTDVDVSVSASGCEVYSVKCTNEPSDAWDDGDKPKITIVLYVTDEDSYRFDGSWKKSDVSLPEADGTVTSVTDGSSGKKLTIKVELPRLEREEGFYEDALEVNEIEFDDETGIGHWQENEYADRYEVRIFRNDSYLAGSFKTTELDYDFSKYFTRKGTYHFKVRGVRDKAGSTDDFRGNWNDSDEITVDAEEAEEIRLYGGYDDSYTSSSTTNNSSGSNSDNNGPAGKAEQTAGGWMQNSVGWWWCNPDRTYPANIWKEINGAWYYFDPAGYCVINTWIKSQDGSTWYFCGETGAMVTNVWVQSGNDWYYCGPDGAMWRSRLTPDGHAVDSDGRWIHQ